MDKVNYYLVSDLCNMYDVLVAIAPHWLLTAQG